MPRKKPAPEPSTEATVVNEPETLKASFRARKTAPASVDAAKEAAPPAKRPSRRAKAPPAPEPEPEQAPEPEPVKAPKPKARSRKKAPPAIVDEDGRFVVLEWRPVTEAPSERRKSAEKPAESEAEGDERGPRRRRRRGRGGRRPDGESPPEDGAETTEETEVEPIAAEPQTPRSPERPAEPARPFIPTPADAPQIAVLGGVPTIVKNLRAYPPILFFGNSSDERRAKTVQEEVRLAGENGVHIHSHLLEFEVDESQLVVTAELATYLLAQTLQSDPDAQILFRIVFVPPRNWENVYPDAAYVTSDGSPSEPSVCDDRFWSDAQRLLERFVKTMRLAPHADRVLGVHLDRAEWFAPEGRGYDSSRAAQAKFRDWARTRYSNDEVTLRAAWFDGRASFDSISIPRAGSEVQHDEFVRSSRRDRRFVDYHLFLGDITVGRIGELAYAVKAASEGYYLVGVSYGYTFEWSHPASGHLALGKLLRTREIDIVAGPPSYRNREPGGTCPFPCPIDSIALNGKLFISEEDFKTKLGADVNEPDDFNPVIKTPQALDSMHWRGAGAAFAHAAGVSWMDLWGNGWLKTPSIWKRGESIAHLFTRRLGTEFKDPDVAVLIDERALAYLIDSAAFAFLVQNVRESVLRSGLSAGFFLVSDLAHREHFPDAKLYLFVNGWDMRGELRSAIKTRLQRDGKVLFWLYAAGLFDGGRESLERTREVTGIALKPQPFHSKSGTTLLSKRHPLCGAFPDRGLIGGTKMEPSYFAIPEEGIVLGEYTQTGLPSFVVKEFGGDNPEEKWTSVFLGEPIVSPALIRALGQLAGAHVYNFHDDVVHVRPPFLTVHCGHAGPRAITLPPNWSAFDVQTSTYEATEGNSVRFNAVEGSTKTFLVGPRAELDAMLHTPLGDLTKVDVLPDAPPNVRHDEALFDIPIMPLGDWMEGDLSDEAADDWLLRPQLPPDPEPEPAQENDDRSGRRRRRRRGGRDRQGSEEVVTATAERFGDDDFQMNVTFRKRE